MPTDGAPKVEDPLDTAKFQSDPCLSLTSKQSKDIFDLAATGTPRNETLGKACSWNNADTGGDAEVMFLDKDPRGLSAVYGVMDEWAYFKEMTIEGQPAVARSAVDGRDQGSCSIVVGASDEIAFVVSVGLSLRNIGVRDPCEVNADVASEVVKTMKQG